MADETQARERGRRRVLRQGVVISDKMDKTITVQMDRQVKHPLYGKYVRRKTRFKAHDPHNTCHNGDVVEIEFCRPLAKSKCWRLVRVLKKGAETLVAEGRLEAFAEGGGEA